jgi:hypothetical protein
MNNPLYKEDDTDARRKLKDFSFSNPRDDLSLVAIAAWVNTTPDKLPAEMKFHTCQATKDAWKRVAKAIKDALSDTPDEEICDRCRNASVDRLLGTGELCESCHDIVQAISEEDDEEHEVVAADGYKSEYSDEPAWRLK